MGLVVVFISLRAGVRIVLDWRMKENARKNEAANAAVFAGAETGSPPGQSGQEKGGGE
jgi:simple sugar transport system permease protein